MVINLTRSQETQIKCLISLRITDNCRDGLCYRTGRQSQCAFRDQGMDNQPVPLGFTTASLVIPHYCWSSHKHTLTPGLVCRAPHPSGVAGRAQHILGSYQGGVWGGGYTPGKGKGISESFELWPNSGPSKGNDQRETEELFGY